MRASLYLVYVLYIHFPAAASLIGTASMKKQKYEERLKEMISEIYEKCNRTDENNV